MLYRKILAIYPDLTRADFRSGGTISLQDNSDGLGPFIARWEHPTYAQPTQAQLDAVVLGPVVPRSVSSRQFRLQLRSMSRYAAAKTYITGADEPTQIYFEFEPRFKRNDPEILAMQAHFNLTTAEMDQVFINAAQIG